MLLLFYINFNFTATIIIYPLCSSLHKHEQNEQRDRTKTFTQFSDLVFFAMLQQTFPYITSITKIMLCMHVLTDMGKCGGYGRICGIKMEECPSSPKPLSPLLHVFVYTLVMIVRIPNCEYTEPTLEVLCFLDRTLVEGIT